MFVCPIRKQETAYRYEDIHPISGMLKKLSKISRWGFYVRKHRIFGDVLSDPDGQWINVNEMMKSFGGGGRRRRGSQRDRSAEYCLSSCWHRLKACNRWSK